MSFSKFIWPIWIAAILAMVAATFIYSNDAGSLGTPVADISRISTDNIFSDGDEETFLFFFHPKCPCTSASITELKNIINDIKPVTVNLIGIALADSTDSSWKESTNYREFSKIKGSRIIDDYGGSISVRLGAETSGVLGHYNSNGQLLFWGGVTASRGHEGRAKAYEIITSYFKNRSADEYIDFSTGEVFGCGLYDSICNVR
jgi:hypothetical protein